MQGEAWNLVGAAFERAIALSGDTRKAFLDELSEQDPGVFKEVSSLLHYHDTADSEFLEEPIGPKVAKVLIEKEQPTFRHGETIGDFEIVRTLGRGSFAKVYLARQISLGRKIALKVSANVGEEAQTMAHLEHDHIVSVFSETIDATTGLRMICMQYIPGCTLEKVLDRAQPATVLTGERMLSIIDKETDPRTRFDPSALKDRETLNRLDAVSALAWVGIKISDALEYAHQKGVLHLDIKPGNILLSPYGRPLLGDFNISINQQGKQPDGASLLGGTLDYMAPEHLAAFKKGGEAFAQIDKRADIYSLGVVLKEMLSRSPIPGTEAEEMLRILNKCTAEDPSQRFQSAAELSQILHGCLERRVVKAAFPKPTGWNQMVFDHPLWMMVAVIFVPQAIASIVNVAYNGFRIVSRLTPDQQEYFRRLCLVWNPLIFVISTLVLTAVLLPIFRFFLNTENLYGSDPQKLAKMRSVILRYPLWVGGITTVSWAISACVFPAMLDHFHGPIAATVYEHFFISFFLSWLIALTYSFVLAQYLGIRVLYPRAWFGCSNVQETARQELRSVAPRMRLFYFMAGFIPLVGALVLIFVEPSGMDPVEYDVYQELLAMLIGTGMLGFFFALRASDKLSRTMYALTGTLRRER